MRPELLENPRVAWDWALGAYASALLGMLVAFVVFTRMDPQEVPIVLWWPITLYAGVPLALTILGVNRASSILDIVGDRNQPLLWESETGIPEVASRLVCLQLPLQVRLKRGIFLLSLTAAWQLACTMSMLGIFLLRIDLANHGIYPWWDQAGRELGAILAPLSGWTLLYLAVNQLEEFERKVVAPN